MWRIKLVITPILVIGIAVVMWFFCYGDLIIPYFTFLAIVVALFREKIFEFYYKAELEITASPSSDLMHEVDDRHKKKETWTLNEKQYWYGIRIKNKGPANAKNVEVYFKGLSSNIIKDFAIYNAISLRRSWVHSPLIKHLSPDVSIRWDVCYLHKKSPERISFSFVKTPNALKKIKCKRGKVAYFKFEVIAKADNAKIEKREIEIKFRGKYNKGFEINDC